MSVILGSTFSDTTADTTLSTNRSVDGRPPAGFDIQCQGLNTEGNNPDTVGVIFQLTVPSGYTLDQGKDNRTGSWMSDTRSNVYDEWILGVDNDGGRGGTYGIEIWFSQEDIDGKTWTMPFKLSVVSGGSTTTYTYTFTKGGSGGGH